MENKNQNQEPKKDQPIAQDGFPKKNRSSLVFILFLLAVLLAVVTWLYVDQKQTTKEIETILTAEKDSLRTNLEHLRMEYDSLETDNDSLNVQLGREKERIDDLLGELKHVKATNYAKIKSLQKELGTLRAVAKSYIRQIDSLNTMNQELIAENIKVKNEIQEARSTNKELEESNKDLSGKVELARTISAGNIEILPINSRGKVRNKANKVSKIKVCCTIKENVLADAGEKMVYLRIAGPDGFILAKSENDLFEFEGEQIIFSAKRPVDYANKNVDLCIFWENNGELLAGSYDAYLFIDGYQIGQSTFTLE